MGSPHAAVGAAVTAATWRRLRPEWAASKLSELGRWGCGRHPGREPGSQRSSEGACCEPGSYSSLEGR